MARRRPSHRFATRLALFACLWMAFVPGAGLVICFQADGSIAIGMGTACPCGLEEQSDHPPCSDVRIDGLRDVAPTPPPLPEHTPAGSLALMLDTPPPIAWLTWTEPRAGPKPLHDPPVPRVALTARRAVVLLI